MVKLQVYRCLIFVVIAFMIHGANTSFANSELTLAGAIESDPASKEKELLVKFRHKDKEEKFLNKLSLNQHRIFCIPLMLHLWTINL